MQRINQTLQKMPSNAKIGGLRVAKCLDGARTNLYYLECFLFDNKIE